MCHNTNSVITHVRSFLFNYFIYLFFMALQRQGRESITVNVSPIFLSTDVGGNNLKKGKANLITRMVPALLDQSLQEDHKLQFACGACQSHIIHRRKLRKHQDEANKGRSFLVNHHLDETRKTVSLSTKKLQENYTKNIHIKVHQQAQIHLII